MIIKSATIFCLITLLQSATIRQNDIPVELQYDGSVASGKDTSVESISNDILKSSDASIVVDPQNIAVEPEVISNVRTVSITDLDGKKEEDGKSTEIPKQFDGKPEEVKEEIEPLRKLSEVVEIEEVSQKITDKPAIEEIKEKKQGEEKPTDNEPPQQENITEKLEDEKKDVLPEDPPQALRSDGPVEIKEEETPNEPQLKSEKNQEEPVAQEQKQELPQLSQEQEKEPQHHLRGIFSEEQDEKNEEKSVQLKGDSYLNHLEYSLQEAREVITNGLKKLKESVASRKLTKPEEWEILEKKIDVYFEEEKRRLQTKQDQPPQNNNFLQNVANNFISMFGSVFPTQPTASSTQSDEGTGGESSTGAPGGSGSNPFQGVISFFQTGVDGIYQAVVNIRPGGSSTSNTVLGDPTTAAPGTGNVFQSIASGINNFVSTISGGAIGGSGGQPPVAGAQGDTGTAPQKGPVQQFINNVGSTINNIVRPPQSGQVVSAGTGENSNPPNLIQQWGENIGNTLQQFNPLRPGSSAPVTPSTAAPVAAPPASDQGIKKPQDVSEKHEEVIQVSAQSTPEKQTSVVLPVAPALAPESVIASDVDKTTEKRVVPEPVKIAEPVEEPKPVEDPKPVITLESEESPLPEKPVESAKQLTEVAASLTQLSVGGTAKTIEEKVLTKH